MPVINALSRALVVAVLAAIAVPSSSFAADRLPRIIGGVPAAAEHWPSIGSLGWRDSGSLLESHFCGASLIAPQVALTAAHCFDATNVSEMQVTFQTTDLSQPAGQTARVVAASLPATFDFETMRDDVAVVHLDRPVDVPLARMATLEQQHALVVPGTPLAVAGWGATRNLTGDDERDADAYQPVLLSTTVTARPVADCVEEWQAPAGTSLCTSTDGVHDSCQGDSGGPLTVDDGAGPLLVGIVSYGADCADAESPGVYTSVAGERAWIDRQLQPLPPAPRSGTVKVRIGRQCKAREGYCQVALKVAGNQAAGVAAVNVRLRNARGVEAVKTPAYRTGASTWMVWVTAKQFTALRKHRAQMRAVAAGPDGTALSKPAYYR